MNRIRWAAVIFCVILIGLSILGRIKNRAFSADEVKETKMQANKIESKTTTSDPAVPPIDALAPPLYETVTFGLG